MSSKNDPTKRLFSNEEILEMYHYYQYFPDTTVVKVANMFEINPRTLRKYFDQIKQGKLLPSSLLGIASNRDNFKQDFVNLWREYILNDQQIKQLATKYNFDYTALHQKMITFNNGLLKPYSSKKIRKYHQSTVNAVLKQLIKEEIND